MTTPVQLSAALAGRYTVEREIGRGGMATVFLARDERHHRPVALKLLNPELGAVLGVERFLSEIRVTANLQHPNLLPLFDSGSADGLLFYVMPFVDGESLRARLDRERQLPVDEAVRIAVAVASALEYAHGHGVIHRDLKPENILLQSGQPVVADFGIALAVSNAGGTRVTQTGLSLGTPQYMSPEQATGDRAIDGRSDIYSLAAMTYEMLTGEPPHTGTTMQAIIARVLTERHRPVRVMRPSIPDHVEMALDRALEKLPADRWPTAREFADCLEGRAVSMATRAGARSTAASAARTWRSRLRDPVVIALAAIAVAGTAFGARQWNASRTTEARPVVRLALTLPRGTVFKPTTQQSVAISPDGRTIAFIGRSTLGLTQVFLRSLHDPEVRPVGGSDNAIAAFFSPDGKWLGVVATERLVKIALDGGAVLPVERVSGIFGGAAWSPRGEIVVSATNGTLAAIPDNGGAPRRICTAASTGYVYHGFPLPLPDGETVIYASWSTQATGSARIAVASLASGACRVTDIAGVQPIALTDGVLVYATAAGVIMGKPFDPAAPESGGPAVPLLTDIEINAITGGAHVAMSNDGTLVYVNGSPPLELIWADAGGATRPALKDVQPFVYPRLSPDGKRLAVTVTNSAQRDIWVYDLTSGVPTKLTTGGFANDRPEWTPDGKRILYRTSRGTRSALWWRAADLSAPEAPLLAHDRADFFEGVVTPDGKTLVYQLDTAGADVLYRQLAGDTTDKPVAVSAAFVESQARVSPDGHWIAFVSTESGADQVFVQSFPTAGARIQVSSDGGREPVWSRDGSRLFYRGDRHFIAAAVRLQPTFSVVSRDVLFDNNFGQAIYHANYDVSVDGRSLLVLRPTEDPLLMVAYNWREELRARLRGANGSARTGR